MDSDGLIPGEINADGPRLFSNEDFRGYETWDYAGGDFAGHVAYEDSLMTTGRFIHAEVLRHLTRNDGEGLTLAERAAGAVLAVSAAGDAHEPGYLPKPYGGLHKAAVSRGISSDQYEHALFGLWALRNVSQDQKLCGAIEQSIVRWAHYFRRHQFCYDYYGRVRVTPARAVHGLGLFLPLCLIAHRITGETVFIEAMERQLAPIVQGDFAEKVSSNPNTTNLTVMGLVYCWQHDVYRRLCECGIETCVRRVLPRLSRDGLAYCYNGGSDTKPLEPGYRTGKPPLNYKFLLWRSNVKGADSCKVAHTLILAHRVLPEHGWRDQALRILERFAKPTDFLRYYDHDGRQIPPDYAYMRKCLCNQFVAAWLQTFFLAIRPSIGDPAVQ